MFNALRPEDTRAAEMFATKYGVQTADAEILVSVGDLMFGHRFEEDCDRQTLLVAALQDIEFNVMVGAELIRRGHEVAPEVSVGGIPLSDWEDLDWDADDDAEFYGYGDGFDEDDWR